MQSFCWPTFLCIYAKNMWLTREMNLSRFDQVVATQRTDHTDNLTAQFFKCLYMENFTHLPPSWYKTSK